MTTWRQYQRRAWLKVMFEEVFNMICFLIVFFTILFVGFFVL